MIIELEITWRWKVWQEVNGYKTKILSGVRKMDKKVFIEQMKNCEPMDKESIMKILVDAVDSDIGDGNPRGHKKLIIVMEELAELTKEVSKELREKGDITNITEELADVQLCIYYVQEIVGIDDKTIEKAVSVKANRIGSELYKTGSYK